MLTIHTIHTILAAPQAQHNFVLRINFAGIDQEVLARVFRDASTRHGNARKTVASHPPDELAARVPKRLYKRLCHRALGVDEQGSSNKKWGNLSDNNIARLVDTFTASEVQVDGKATYKDEFVTAGGACHGALFLSLAQPPSLTTPTHTHTPSLHVPVHVPVPLLRWYHPCSLLHWAVRVTICVLACSYCTHHLRARMHCTLTICGRSNTFGSRC